MKVHACTAAICFTCLLQPYQTAAFTGSEVGKPTTFAPLSILNATPNPSSTSSDESSRRSFFQKSSISLIAALVVTDAAVNNLSGTPTDHDDRCASTKCAGSEDLGCSCTSCGSFQNVRYGPPAAVAATYDTKEEAGSGAAQRSPDYYAQVIQMKETNARLEASGYKLDTREEEQLKISNAFASFSYDDATSKSSSKKKSSTSNSKNGGETKRQ